MWRSGQEDYYKEATLLTLSCYSRTVCVTGVENQEVEVCVVEYEPRVHQVMSVTHDDAGDH